MGSSLMGFGTRFVQSDIEGGKTLGIYTFMCVCANDALEPRD